MHTSNGKYPPLYQDRVLSMPAPRPTVIPRQYWPPPPSVEEEAESLSREYVAVKPGETELRGQIDQQPILLEADLPKPNSSVEPKESSRADGSDSKDYSSDESLGPSTPIDQLSENPERRFILQSNQDRKNISSDDNGKIKPVCKDQKTKDHEKSDSTLRGRSLPKLDPLKLHGTEASTNIETSRKPSPYFYSPNSGKSTFSGDHLMSPAALSPDLRHPNSNGKLPAAGANNSLGENPTTKRTASSSSLNTQHRPSSREMVGTNYVSTSYSQSLEPDLPPRTQRSVSAFETTGRTQRRNTFNPDSDSESVSGEDVSRRKPTKPGPRNLDALDRRKQRSNSRVKSDEQNSRYEHLLQPTMPSRLDLDSIRPSVDSSTYARSSKETQGRSPTNSPSVSPFATLPPSPRVRLEDEDRTLITEKRNARSRPSLTYVNTKDNPTGLKQSPGAGPHENRRTNHLGPDMSTFVPDAPLQSKHSFERIRPQGPAQREKPSSRRTSPLPAPHTGRSSSKAGLKIDVQGPSPSPAAKTWPIGGSELPNRPLTGELSAPFLSHSPRPQRPRTPNPGSPRPEILRDHRGSSPSNSRHTPRPINSSPSRATMEPLTPDIPVSLPPCPCHEFVAGHDDWSTLSTVRDFEVCPTCRKDLEDAGFEGEFIPSHPRSSGYQTRCDLGVPWVRMAWLLILQGKAHHDMIQRLMTVFAHERPCPGKQAGVADWYRVYDVEREEYIAGFGICASCVKSLEIIFPNLKGAFHLDPSYSSTTKRRCDLATNSVRFPRYVDLLEEISTQANVSRREPKMTRFIDLAARMASIRECGKDNQYRGMIWHFVPHLPDFTVCEECYLDVVWPAAAAGSEVAAQFNQEPRVPRTISAQLSCQLYSPRMREVFQTSCHRNDLATLGATALARVGKERELQGLAERSMHLPEDWRAQEMSRLSREWKKWE